MLINKNLILLKMDAANKECAISELAKMAYLEGKISSINEYAKSVLDREKSCTTGIGNGIAIPHGKSDSVKEAVLIFGKSTDGIEWNSLDSKPVNIVFLIGVPEQNVDNMHLKLLSQLSRKLMNDSFVDLLKNAKTKEEVLNALDDIKVN